MPNTKGLKPNRHFNLFWQYPNQPQPAPASACPYCHSREISKRGQRRKKYESIQLYLCQACQKTFSDQIVKNKRYPLKVILDALSLYNLGYSQSQACQLIKEKYGTNLRPSTLGNWVREFATLLRYARLRPQAVKLYPPQQTIRSFALRHRQVYYFRYHQAKLDLLLKSKEFIWFDALKTWLHAVKTDCPHQLFLSAERSSQASPDINLEQVQIKHTTNNHATRLARLALQAVGHNRLRHEALQQFMLANDSVTVAMEVPVYLEPADLEYFAQKQNFQIPFPINEPITGHIDLLQVRNGLIHILDYKPKARTEKPYAQLLAYALALSRSTSLKLMDFKCAWFDEHDYFEFFPLHLIHKPGPKK